MLKCLTDNNYGRPIHLFLWKCSYIMLVSWSVFDVFQVSTENMAVFNTIFNVQCLFNWIQMAPQTHWPTHLFPGAFWSPSCSYLRPHESSGTKISLLCLGELLYVRTCANVCTCLSLSICFVLVCVYSGVWMCFKALPPPPQTKVGDTAGLLRLLSH